MSDSKGSAILAALKDIRVWVGASVGVIGALSTVLAMGGEVLEAPEEAYEAQLTADSALDLATENNGELADLSRSIRIVFCTKENWLSPEAAAQLECWRIRRSNQ